MQRKNVGYFEGTDPNVLTALVCEGYDTLPISNGFDGHGRHVLLMNQLNKPDLIIGYLHKVVAPDELEGDHASHREIFHLCRTYGVPVLLVVPVDRESKARTLLGEIPDVVHFTGPKRFLDAALSLLR